jgi:5'(3')-deoxyribonucleotidase
MEPKITIITDLDDVLWNLVEHWIYYYKMFMKGYDYLAYNAHDKYLDKSMLTSWDITSCLKPTDTDMFWNVSYAHLLIQPNGSYHYGSL